MGIKFQFFLSLAVFSFASLLRAQTDFQRYALILGGGGDPPGNSTIFDGGISDLGQNLKSAGYQTTVAYDGGHSQSTALAKSIDPQATDFDPKDVNRQIKALLNQMQKMKNGGQVLVVLDSHGAPRSMESKSTVHDVFYDYDNTAIIDIKKLEPIQAAAQKMGIKLAIVDDSCYSGQSLALADKYPNTCVITSASDKTQGLEDFSVDLYTNLKPGSNLEQSFLSTRNSNAGYPNISTCQGRIANKALNDLMNYLGNESDGSDQSAPAGLNLELNHGEYFLSPNQCPFSENLNLQNQMQQLSQLNMKALGISDDLIANFKHELDSYKAHQAQEVADFQLSMNKTIKVGDLDVNYYTLLNLDSVAKTLKTMPSSVALQSQNPADSQSKISSYTSDFLMHLKDLQRTKDHLMKNDPDFSRLEKNQGESFIADDIAEDNLQYFEQAAYQQIYQAADQSCQKQVNPCRNFNF